MSLSFDEFFALATSYPSPRPWQRELALSTDCRNRLIHVPTGQGKTEGVALAWLWNRVARHASDWPLRLVWCLPMRVLVEQTASRLDDLLARLSEQSGADRPRILVHRILGGVEAEEWHLTPECPTVLVGTQDMLLSRALNRGYASRRARWPIEYGLLNQDCLWILDEVQLMDVGLVTSVQLQALRQSSGVELRPSRTWWMSATLQPSWLRTPESLDWLPRLEEQIVRVRAGDRRDSLWRARKALRLESLPMKDDPKLSRFAALVWEAHGERDQPAVTVVVVNRVETAARVYRELTRLREGGGRSADVRLVHSRFRGRERRAWASTFLNRAATEHPAADRIIVATQIIEAGVDITCSVMVTENAPWASLVQRFGRVARYGGQGLVIVVDRELSDANAAPYEAAGLVAAREVLRSMSDVGLSALTALEEGLSEDARSTLYPYSPLHVLTPDEYDDLFDTTADLSGADLDISRFIRTGDERDLSVAWAAVTDDAPLDAFEPRRDDLCPVSVSRAREWLFAGGSLKPGCRAWAWDYLDGEWKKLRPGHLYPGQLVVVAADWGGYDEHQGFTGEPAKVTGPVLQPADALVPASDSADRADERDSLSENAVAWMTIATHGADVGRAAASLAGAVGLDPGRASLLDLAGRLHDWGKAHEVFQGCIRREGAPAAILADVAKAPDTAWLRPPELYPEPGAVVRRRGFRHELASVLAILEALCEVAPDHLGLQGPFAGSGLVEDIQADRRGEVNGLLQEMTTLTANDLDLVLYLIAAHHGKVRAGLHVMPHDQNYPIEWNEPERGLPLRGIREGDVLPATRLCDKGGLAVEMPSVRLSLQVAGLGLSRRYGRSWSERVLELKRRLGPGTVAFLEALFRAADVRATRAPSPDPLVMEPAS